ncbi:MAG TPA: OsmC family protein [Anaerolineales bacterium]|jgi:uncharacterized OsmC-like protein
MIISANVQNSANHHLVSLTTNNKAHDLTIAPKSAGFGSSVNGGEVLLLAVATCYCNDIYREAFKLDITVERVEVDVEGEFGGEGEPASSISYRARVTARAGEARILELMKLTDTVAEVHNTLRRGMPVTIAGFEAVSI